MIEKEQTKKHSGRILRAVLVTALVVALSVITTMAVVHSRVNMNVIEKNKDFAISGDAGKDETQKNEIIRYDVSFEPVDGEYIELGYWYPETLPGGFAESFVSEHWRERQIVHYTNGDDTITYMYGIAHEAFVIGALSDGTAQTVKVKGTEIQLFHTENSAVCAWTQPERGLGFCLMYEGEKKVDLLPMAKSVTEQAEGHTPTFEVQKAEALAELGMYLPTALPEGYALTDTNAMPTSTGGGWYGYVWLWFENAGHKTIHLKYETLGHADDATQEQLAELPEPSVELAVANYRDSYGYELKYITICGAPGCLVEKPDGTPVTVAWYVSGLGPKEGMMFRLSGEDLTSDELVAIAQSVALQK